MTPQPETATSSAKMDTRRNVIAYTGDTVGFFSGMAFIPATTVLVGLASALTRDKTLIGIVAMAWGVASLFPQLIAARFVQGKRRTKPIVILTSAFGRQTMLLFALWLLFTNAQSPLLTIWLLIGAIVIFNVVDSITGIAWFDMLSRNLSPRGRGRILGTAQFLGSLAGIGSGLIVSRILSPEGLPFPQNYAVVIICAWLGFMVSFAFQFAYQENPATQPYHASEESGSFTSRIVDCIKTDKVFRRVLLTRLLSGLEAMSAAFYVVYVKERLQLPDTAIGVFSLSFIIGGIVGVAWFTWLASRTGARNVVRAATVLQAAAPIGALGAALIPGIETIPIVGYIVFALILAINGAASRAYILGFGGYAIDIAPATNRSMYVAIINTLSGLVGLSPVLSGIWLDAASGNAGAYPYLFGVVAAIAGAGAIISFTLPRPTQLDA
ncbi:MAG TPA: MFS transporter [Anaerolineae bacterium]